jgi:hypothetical protein
VPGGLLASALAVDPSHRYLYVSAENADGATTALEYTAGSAALLARAGDTPLQYSVGGAALTAVPGGVWASFRTGMLGQTVLLRQGTLGVVRLPAREDKLYRWGMDASTGYGGGSLWLISGDQGTVACVAPKTGIVRAQGKLAALANGAGVQAVSLARHEFLASGESGITAVTAPSRCWP